MRLTSVSASICGLALAAASITAASVPPSQRAARRAAPRLLAALRLPAGAVPVAREPSGDQGLLSPMPSLSATSARVDRHAWWRVPGTPAQVVAYIEAHPPSGARLEGTGSGPGSGERSLEYTWPPRARLSSRRLAVTALPLSSTTVGVLAQAEAVWIVPRPAGEHVPAGVHEVDVTSRPLGGSARKALTVTKPARVRRLVAMIDALPIVQPGAMSCPAEGPGGAWVIDLAFRAGAGGRPLARAHYLDFAPVDTPSGPCTPVDFSIRGRARTPLQGGNFVGRLDHLLGTRLTR